MSSRYSHLLHEEETHDFEKGRIRALQDERLSIQKKTFTKWVNSFLNKSRMEINDLFTDLADGKYLMRLLEIISGERLGKPNSGKMRVHKIENVNKCLAFLHTKVRLESIGAEDIVDGNPRLILGLIWTIILRFQIQEIEINVDEQEEHGEKKSAKEALMMWCQRNVRGYRDAHIRDFTSSWRDGMAFNALLHNQNPDCMDYSRLHPSNHLENLKNAFDVAENKFGIPRLLDPEDVDVQRPDEKSIMTYIASYYHTFSKLNKGQRGGKKITFIISKIKSIEDLQRQYEIDSKALLEWIVVKTEVMKNRSYANTIDSLQVDFRKFKTYTTSEKPPKCKEKVNLEASFFEIEMKLKELRQPPYVPPENQRLSDIEQAWKMLEKEEHLQETSLRSELMRLERLEQLAAKFHQKVGLRNSYLDEMIQVLSDPRYGANLFNVEASLKKHEAISADILSREDRFKEIEKLMNHLDKENYHQKALVSKQGGELLKKWELLMGLLEQHQHKLEMDNQMLSHLRDLETVHASVISLMETFASEEFQKATNIDESMQKLNLLESEVNAIADSIRKLKSSNKRFASVDSDLKKNVAKKLEALEKDQDELITFSKKTRQRFEDIQCVQQIRTDLDDVQHWLTEKTAVTSSPAVVKDLNALSLQLEKHKTSQNEFKKWYKKYESTQQSLKKFGLTDDEEFTDKVKGIDKLWDELKSLMKDRELKLAALFTALNLNSDLNDAESWLKDVNSLVSAADVGTDEVTCQALTNRHKEVCQQIKHFDNELVKLSNAHEKYVREVPNSSTKKKVFEQRRVPQVRAIYSYSGHGVDVVKGELMFLLAKSNKDWWNVRTANGNDGFVPANYVKEVEPKVVQVEVVKEVEQFKTGEEDLSPKALKARVTTLNDLYNAIVKMASEKQTNLENSMKFFAFKAQCERVKYWLSERQRDLMSTKTTQESSLKVDEICKSISGYEGNVVQLRNAAKRLSEEVPARKSHVHTALQEVEKLWANLDSIRQTSERKIINSVQLEKFKKTCADTIDWIQEKLLYIDSLDSMFTVNALDNMTRRHKALKREMMPIKDRIDEVRAAHANVKRTFNEEAASVDPNVEKMITLYNQLVERLEEKEEELASLAHRRKFEKMSKEYLEWANSKLRQLERNPVQDLAFADESKVLIEELEAEVLRKNDDCEEILHIGNAVAKLDKDDEDVSNQLKEVEAVTNELKKNLAHQKDYIRRIDQYKLFSQESRVIESHISSCKRLLSNFDTNLNDEELDDVTKRHNLLAAMIEGYEDRIKKFLESANNLNPEEHIKYEECMHKKDEIATDWKNLNEDCAKCQAKLQDNKAFLDLATTIDEMQKFIEEREKIVQDMSYRDPSHLRTKFKKHEALDGEVKAHGSEMKLIKLRVDKLVEADHPQKDAIATKYDNLAASWERLLKAIHGKYDFIKESLIDVDVTNGIDNINSKIMVLSKELNSPVEIQDVKHCNQQIAKHKANHASFKTLQQKFKTLEADASDVGGNKSNKNELKKNLSECCTSLEELKPMFDKHFAELQKSLKFHEMMSELNTELQWVKEKEKLILVGDVGKGLMQVRSQTKRHKSLEEEVSNHLPVIYELIERASGYSDETKQKTVDDACSILAEAAEQLQVKLAERANELEASVKIFTLIEEINEIENWIELKRPLLEAPINGKDEDTILMYLTKQKGVELELDSYSGIISEVKNNAQALSQSKHPLIAQLKHKDQSLSQEINALQKMTRARRNALMTQLQYHEFLRECNELRKWMREKAVIAASQDLGQDYEHLETLMAKYETLRQEISTGKEKLDSCVSLSQRMKGADETVMNEVNSTKDTCVIEWEELVKMIRLRGQKLEAAGEIHKFNRDIAEALLRIQEKSSSLGNEQVKDIKSIERLLRLQDIFDNDLVALRGQLQSLEDDSDKLQSKYPGPNAEHIAEQLEIVQSNWEELQDKARLHRQMLVSNLSFQKFLLKCQDLLTWCSHLKIMLLSEEKVTSVAEAQLLKSEHENLKSEIASKEDNFRELVESGNGIKEQKGQTFAEEIEAKQAQVLEERGNLHMAWQQKKIYIEQLLDLQYFLRDTKQITAFMVAQERVATRSVNIEDIETIDKELKYFENNSVKMKNFEERTKVLHKQGKKLVDQNHFDSNFIKRSVAEILQQQEKVLDQTRGREIYLKHMKTSLEFQRDVAEVEHWMSDKMDKFSKASKEYEQGSLSEKIKFLQKYTVFENEVSKHQVIIDGIVTKGELLINSNHKVEETKVKLGSLLKLWEDLKTLSEQIRKELQDALDLFSFETEIDEIEAIVREKEYMSNVSDIGKDLEHCKDLLHKLSETDAEMNVNEKFDKARHLAKKVQGSKMSTDAEKANEKLERVAKKWHSIQDCIENYRKALNEALQAHQLNSDMFDVADIISEKKKALSFDTKTLSSSDTDKVYQKCVTIQDFIKTLEPKIVEFKKRIAKSIRKDHPLEDRVNATFDDLQKGWQECLNFSVSQLGLVTRHEELMKSMKVINDQKNVLKSTRDEMDSMEFPNVVAEVDVALTKHADLRASIQIQQDILKSSMSKLQDAEPEDEANAILFNNQKEELEVVNDLAKSCDSTWNEVNQKLLQSKDYLKVHLKLAEISSWIDNADTLLKVDGTETSTGDLDAFLRKQTNFERALQQQQKEFAAAKAEAEELIEQGNFRKDTMSSTLDQVDAGLHALQERNSNFIEELKGLRNCRIILRRINEMRSWIKEKLHVALDESYLELTNILSKLQRHSVLESEISANAERIFDIEKEVNEVQKDSGISSSTKKDVVLQMEELSAEWNHLKETAKSKQMRLLQANKAVEFVNNVDEIIHSLKEADEVLRNDDLGKDVESVVALLKKYATVEVELCQKEAQLEDLKKTSAKFEQENHFAHAAMTKKVQDAMEMLEKLQSQAIVLKDNLEDSKVYHSYVKDIHDALLWIKEKIALVSVSDFGKSLVEVQSMMKRHQLLEVDVANQNASVNALIEKGEQLVKSNHQQSPEIEKLVEELVRRRNELRDAASLRKLRLDDALQSQQFFIQCHEINSWIVEKDLMVSQKIHIDNDFIQSLLKRIEALEMELVTHKIQVQELQEEADLFVQRCHFESAEITQQMESISTAFTNLLAKVKSQKEALMVKRRVYQFLRDSEEMEDWINSQLTVASSEDYGKDLDDVDRLIHNFDLFLTNLNAHEDKLTHFNTFANELINDVHDQEIEGRTREVRSSWDDLMELAMARKEALVGAKKVHSFDKKIDDTLDWILEKEALLTIDINCQDIETIQEMKQKQQGIRQDVKAINEQVMAVNNDADVLVSTYPDAVDHIVAKRRELLRAVEKLDDMVKQRDTQLSQNEQFLDYHNTFRDLMAWANEFLARMCNPELSRDLHEATTIYSRHGLLHDEMTERDSDFAKFEDFGHELIKQGHYMSEDIQDKISSVVHRKKTLLELWTLRNSLYEQHIDYLKWLKEINDIETWLSEKEPEVGSKDYGNNFDDLDKLMIKQLEMEEALLNKEEKINQIKRITLIESEFKALKAKEEEARREDEQRQENERLEAIKKKEMARRTREKRREDERRRTQEIILPPSHVLNKEPSKAENDIPGFNTRRSMRQGNRWKMDPSNLPQAPAIMEGFLERKQQSNSGGKKSTIRSWKNYYTVISGPLLCFFKDPSDFKEWKNAASAPIPLHNATCERASDYTKKKHVIRLVTNDGSEYLFQASSRESQEQWLEKLNYVASVEPSESVKKGSLSRPNTAPPEPPRLDEPSAEVNEPLYANLAEAGNHHDPESSSSADASYVSSEADGKEKRPGRLSKLLGLRPKISTS